eukprot:TRINITY_DN2311_c0_g1_i1.p1 TRINITY_DN2311_c0_g1~~TRINITY_DN2311_c0_g1_i1.p1  ORF type:complete len:672 (+),score=147.37 TRINITY_DN2311_c0_g1_i1:398-2413(+)
MGSTGASRQDISTGGQQQLFYGNNFSGEYAAGGSVPQQFFYDYNTGATFQAETPEQWDEYMRYISQGEEPQQVTYGEPGSVFVHPDYSQRFAYSQTAPFSAYTPTGTAMGADGQLYNTQAFAQYPGQVFQQPLSPATSYVAVSQALEGTGAQAAGAANMDGGNQPGTDRAHVVGPPVVQAGGRVVSTVALMPTPTGYALPSPTGNQPEFRRFDSLPRASSWVDLTKMNQAQGSPGGASATQLVATEQRPIGMMRTVGQPGGFQPLRPITPLQVQVPSPQLQRLPSSITPSPQVLMRGLSPSPLAPRMFTNISPTFATAFRPREHQGMFGRGRGGLWNEKGGRGRGGRGSGFFPQEHNENRGPRGQRSIQGQSGKQPRGAENVASGGEASEGLSLVGSRDQFNRADFNAQPSKGKFFVIKSYSEDDVHKSIKYNVWASTANGNRRLDQAFREAAEEAGADPEGCPLYLLFSVNASGQFCGVAEMKAPVDFAKSVEYWQQEKWSGQFQVRWHFIKDVPNGQFRHIILENNDNKPVTNSRDTQEVRYELGVEMLNIFKSYAAKTSILDDFEFYDQRQKVMQDKKAARQRPKQQGNKIASATGGDVSEEDLSHALGEIELSEATAQEVEGVPGGRHEGSGIGSAMPLDASEKGGDAEDETSKAPEVTASAAQGVE